MFDGFSSLLKPENTSEFSPRFSVSFSRGRSSSFPLNTRQVASGENFWGFCEAIEKSRGNRKKLVIAMLWGDGGLRSAAVEIRGPSTQKPVRLEVRRAIRVLIFQGFQVTIEYVVFVSSLLVLSDREFWSYLNKCAGVMEW